MSVQAKDRTRRLSTLFRSYMPYGGREGREYECLITEWAADNTHLVAHNKSYEQVDKGLFSVKCPVIY
jgi:threonylcarbamoyladenosine tRNA methylthiotransferase CDKAL1